MFECVLVWNDNFFSIVIVCFKNESISTVLWLDNKIYHKKGQYKFPFELIPSNVLVRDSKTTFAYHFHNYIALKFATGDGFVIKLTKVVTLMIIKVWVLISKRTNHVGTSSKKQSSFRMLVTLSSRYSKIQSLDKKCANIMLQLCCNPIFSS